MRINPIGVDNSVKGAAKVINEHDGTIKAFGHVLNTEYLPLVREVYEAYTDGYLSEPALKTTIGESVDGRSDTLEWLHAKRTYVPMLGAWQTALAGVRAGTGDAHVLCVGDSTTQGLRSGTVLIERGAYPARLAEIMADRFAPAVNGFVPAPSAAAVDPRWVVGEGWLNAGAGQAFRAVGVPSRILIAPGTTMTATTFQDPEVLADTFDVYYAGLRNSGPAGITTTFQATGGAPVSVPLKVGMVNEVRVVTVTAAALSKSNTVTIQNTISGHDSLRIIGIMPRDSTRQSVIVSNIGSSGTTSEAWVDLPAQDPLYDGWRAPFLIKKIAPDLTIIDLGINDASPGAETPIAEYAANIAELVAAAQVSGDALIKTPIPSSGRDMTPYLDVLRALNLPLWDEYAYYGSWDAANDAGFMYDTLHPNGAGYLDIAKRVHLVLSNVPT